MEKFVYRKTGRVIECFDRMENGCLKFWDKDGNLDMVHESAVVPLSICNGYQDAQVGDVIPIDCIPGSDANVGNEFEHLNAYPHLKKFSQDHRKLVKVVDVGFKVLNGFNSVCNAISKL